MNLAKFTVLSVIGVSLWVTLLTMIGYALGDSWNKMIKAFGYAGYVVAAAVIVLVVVFYVRRYRSQSAEDVRDEVPAGDVSRSEEIGLEVGTRPGGHQGPQAK